MIKNITMSKKRFDGKILFLGQLSDSLYERIIAVTSCPKYRLKKYFSNGKEFYFFVNGEWAEEEVSVFEKTIENIANGLSEKDLWLKILTKDGYTMTPYDMHELMRAEYHLDGNVEWYTTLFFTALGGMISFPDFCFRTIEEDIAAGDQYVTINNSSAGLFENHVNE